jgi:gamma-glutamyltranspeptidase/glutathione hydrolase
LYQIALQSKVLRFTRVLPVSHGFRRSRTRRAALSRVSDMTGFNWQNPYPTPRLPVFARNIVSTSHPLAAQAGLRMLWKGGNAVDAAIAAAAAITVVEPVSCGLGGDAFALVWDGKKLHGLNASGVSPAAWNVDYFKRKYGEENGLAKQPKRGWDAVTVPGSPAGKRCIRNSARCRSPI